MTCRIPAPNYPNREALGIEVDFSLPSERIIRALDQIIEWRGAPMVIRCDNGPENISGLIQAWAARCGIRLEYFQPGKPQQNAYVERFKRTVRYEWLSQYYWEDLDEVRLFTTQWMNHYNHYRPNMALGGFTPEIAVGHGRIVLLLKTAKSGGLPAEVLALFTVIQKLV